jgi:hypothetical protein
MPHRLPYIDIPTPEEIDERFVAADAKLAEALEQLVTQAALTAALAPLAAKSDVAAAIAQAVMAAVAPLATKAEVEAAKAAAIREATAGRPNWTETNKRVNELLAPILARLAALEAKG